MRINEKIEEILRFVINEVKEETGISISNAQAIEYLYRFRIINSDKEAERLASMLIDYYMSKNKIANEADLTINRFFGHHDFETIISIKERNELKCENTDSS